MQINRLKDCCYLFFGIFLGLIIYDLVLKYVATKPDFFDYRFIELLRILVMVVLGSFVAYWVTVSTNQLQKKKELCLQLISECNLLLYTQKKLTIESINKNAIQSSSEDTNQSNSENEDGRIILSGFRRINNKLAAIDKICSFIKKKNISFNLTTEFKTIRVHFGENYYSGFTTEDIKKMIKEFDGFEKTLDNLRIELISS